MTSTLPPIHGSPKDKSPPRKLTKGEQEEISVKHCDNAVLHKQQELKKLEAKYYVYAKPQVISSQVAEESAVRQATTEQERRQRTREELERKAHVATVAKTLSEEEVAASVSRLYADSVKIKQDKMRKLEQKYAFKPKTEPKAIDRAGMAASGSRLCVPKKTQLTEEEVNARLGFKK
jgi:thymidine phosphorylase